MAEILGVGGVAEDENFFGLGGSSIQALTLITRIKEKSGVEVPLIDVIYGPTAAEIAVSVEQNRVDVDVDVDADADADVGRVAALTEIWRQVLGKPGLNEDSDVFDSGGSSLHVLQITGQVYETLGTEVRLRDVFSHASPRSLALFLDSAEHTAAGH